MFAGGGTGGHIYPLVAIAENIRDAELRFIGDGALMESVAAGLNIPFSKVLGSKWRRYFSLQNFVDLFKLPIGLVQALVKIWLFMPDSIVSAGGYASFLPLLVGRLFAIPIVICDLDSIPGKVNKFFGKRAKMVFVAYPDVALSYPSDHTVVSGYPMRAGVLKKYEKNEAMKWFGFDGSKPVVFFTTAQQGSQKINETLLLCIIGLTSTYHVIHQCGEVPYDQINKQIRQIVVEQKGSTNRTIDFDYKLFGVMTADQMSLAYSACDVVISRAGTVLFEIAATSKMAIIVPLEGSASNHQEKNAREFEKFGAIVIEEDNFTEHLLLTEINIAMQKKDEVSLKISGFSRVDAASTIANSLVQI